LQGTEEGIHTWEVGGGGQLAAPIAIEAIAMEGERTAAAVPTNRVIGHDAINKPHIPLIIAAVPSVDEVVKAAAGAGCITGDGAVGEGQGAIVPEASAVSGRITADGAVDQPQRRRRIAIVAEASPKSG
jgi:hypothetical protein